MSLEQGLREYFGPKPRRVVIVGVGNPIRGDDAVGPKIIELLEEKPMEDVLVLNTESVPEAFTGKVERYNPTHVLMVDAANFHGAAGETKLITADHIGGIAVSTHSLPLNIFISIVEKSCGIDVLLLGIQPVSIGLGEPMTEPLEAAAVSIANTLYQILSE